MMCDNEDFIIIAKFKQLGKVPLNIVPDQFNDGYGIEETLQTNKSMRHTTCRSLFSDFKLDRQKRASEQDTDNSRTSAIILRLSSILDRMFSFVLSVSE